MQKWICSGRDYCDGIFAFWEPQTKLLIYRRGDKYAVNYCGHPFAYWAISIYNAIISARNGAERAWADVITYERLKNEVIPKIEKVAGEYKEFEASVLQKITRLRSAISRLDAGKIQPELLGDVERLTRSVQEKIAIAVENYPELKSSQVIMSLMSEISDKQENVAAAITIFNQAVQEFNNTIQYFPNHIINDKFHKFDVLPAFRDSKAEAGFEYKPDF